MWLFMSLKNREIFCCEFCGRDTLSESKICGHCCPTFKKRSVTRSNKEEQKGRKALSTNVLSGAEGTNFGDLDEEKSPIKYELREEKDIDIEDFW